MTGAQTPAQLAKRTVGHAGHRGHHEAVHKRILADLRMRIFDQLIDFMKGYPGVAILPMKDLADWCLENPSLWQANTGAAHV